jgi:uncharacterized protein YndB with AHSA1/START domain
MNTSDKIERQMIFKASLDKVWDAITKPEMLSQWFSNRIDVTDLTVGQEFTFDWTEHGYSRAVVEALEPKTRFAYRWENEGVDQSLPLADVPKTLVTFILDEVEGGIRLTLTETGFAALPSPKVNFDQNSTGWDIELVELKNFVEAA